MKVTSVSPSRVNFKGIICPNKYSHYLRESIEEVIPATKKKNENTLKLSALFNSFKNLFKRKNPYSFGGYLYIQDPLKRTTNLGSGVFQCDYDVWCHNIYKQKDKYYSSEIAKEEEKNIFGLLKKKIAEKVELTNADQLNDKSLLEKYGIALLDKDKKISINFSKIK